MVKRLVHAESTTETYAAIAREKELKGRLRAKKLALIHAANPEWADLADGWDAD
jgi:putative endonuclease